MLPGVLIIVGVIIFVRTKKGITRRKCMVGRRSVGCPLGEVDLISLLSTKSKERSYGSNFTEIVCCSGG